VSEDEEEQLDGGVTGAPGEAAAAGKWGDSAAAAALVEAAAGVCGVAAGCSGGVGEVSAAAVRRGTGAGELKRG
jgi:hypothetical protein